MSDLVEFQIEGFEQFLADLRDAAESLLEALQPAMTTALLLLDGTLREYPPASEANSSAQKRWYERGYGPRWRLKDGQVRGYKSSEFLGRRWETRVDLRSGSEVAVLEGEIKNQVSYGVYVQGAEQRGFHRQRGWVTVDDALLAHQDAIYHEFEQGVADWSERFNRGEG